MAVQTFTTANFDTEVLQSDVPVLVDFWASWCGPCKMQGPVVEELSGEVTGVRIGKLDVDAEPDIAGRYGIMSIPTLILFDKGKAAVTKVGLTGKEDLKSMIASISNG